MSNWLNKTEATKELQYQQAFRHDVLSEECLNDTRLIRSNNADTEEFLLNTYDADGFTNQAWRLLGRYIANNTHLSTVDLDACRINDEKMTLLFTDLAKSTSLNNILLGNNDFGIEGVRCMLPFLQNSQNLSRVNLGLNNNINNECFEVLVSALNGTSVKELYIYNCNITDISALDASNLSNLKELNLNNNKIGREGCITISNLLKKEGSTLRHLYLNDTGIDDEGTEILAAALKHNTKLRILDLQWNNITGRGGIALLKVLVDVSSIENTYNSNHSLISCYITNNTSTRKVKSLINSACDMNQKCRWTASEASGRAKVIKYHLNSHTMKELCQLQGIEYSAGSIFTDIEPALLPKVLWLIGSSHGQSELYTALVHTAPELLSYIDRKAKLNDLLKGNTSKASDITAQITALAQQLTYLTAQKADIHRRLELVGLGDTKQLGNKQDEKDKGLRTKRQRS